MERLQSFFLLLLLLLPLSAVRAQDVSEEAQDYALPVYVQVGKTFYKGDSIPEIITPVLPKLNTWKPRNEEERKSYERLVRQVKKLLPYAKLVRYMVIETYSYLETLPDKKSRDEHIKLVEEELKRKYTPVVKKMTRSEGRLLLKLIDRECNQTGLSIARAFIGSFRANVYQSIGLLFGNSLARHYDPKGDDRMLERVVSLVEAGTL